MPNKGTGKLTAKLGAYQVQERALCHATASPARFVAKCSNALHRVNTSQPPQAACRVRTKLLRPLAVSCTRIGSSSVRPYIMLAGRSSSTVGRPSERELTVLRTSLGIIIIETPPRLCDQSIIQKLNKCAPVCHLQHLNQQRASYH